MKKIFSYIVFWLLQLTWGCLLTIPGAIVTLVLICAGKKPERFGPMVYTRVGECWGGLNLGGFIFVDKGSTIGTLHHEAGHAIQNLIFGPFTPFLVTLPSALRYWVFHQESYLKKRLFNLFFLSAALLITTLIAILIYYFIITYGMALRLPMLTIEFIRLYCLSLSLWLTLVELPKHEDGPPYYYDIWFESMANNLTKNIIFKKKGF